MANLSNIYKDDVEDIDKAYLDDVIVFERFNIIQTLIGIADWLGLYVASSDEYSNGVWNDNGSAVKDTSLAEGTAPTLNESWKNGKPALAFNGANSLQIAATADSYNIHNTANTIFVVGQYDEPNTSNEETYITNGNFFIKKNAGFDYADFRSGAFGTFYNHGISYNGVPAFIIGHFVEGNRTLSYLNGDFTVRGVFSSKAFGDTFIGNANLNGNIASIGVTDGQLSSLKLKGIIKEVNDEYAFENINDNFLCFIGDSLTYGLNLSANESWPYLMISGLESTYSEVFRYSNDALSGITIPGYRHNEDTFHYAFSNNYSVNRRILFIWLGSNDFALSGVSAATMQTNMINMVTDALKSGFKKIIIGTVIERSNFISDAGLGAEVETYNAAIVAYDFSTLESTYGANIQVCPLHSDSRLQDPSDATYFQGDEIHLTATGQSVVNDLLTPYYATARGVTVVEDITPPDIDSFTIPINNAYIDVVFSKGIFGDNQAITIPDASDFQITNFSGSGATAISISSISSIDTESIVGGDKKLRFNLSITGNPDGTETFQIQPADGSSVYDVFGNSMLSNATTGVITLNEGLIDATMYLVGAGAGYSVDGNTVTFVDGGGGVGARYTQNIARSMEEVGDEDFEVRFSVSDTNPGAGAYGLGCGPAVTSSPFGTGLTKHCFVTINASTTIRGGTHLSVNASSGVTFNQEYRYRLRYIKADGEIRLEYSDDGEETWSLLVNIDNSQANKTLDLTFPFAVHCAANLGAGNGTVIMSDIKLSPNFSTP